MAAQCSAEQFVAMMLIDQCDVVRQPRATPLLLRDLRAEAHRPGRRCHQTNGDDEMVELESLLGEYRFARVRRILTLGTARTLEKMRGKVLSVCSVALRSSENFLYPACDDKL